MRFALGGHFDVDLEFPGRLRADLEGCLAVDRVDCEADDEDVTTKDQILAASVSRIEQEEMSGWVKVADKLPKP
jgi:hypothetical protein